jgi:hypothetical protein
VRKALEADGLEPGFFDDLLQLAVVRLRGVSLVPAESDQISKQV